MWVASANIDLWWLSCKFFLILNSIAWLEQFRIKLFFNLQSLRDENDPNGEKIENEKAFFCILQALLTEPHLWPKEKSWFSHH